MKTINIILSTLLLVLLATSCTETLEPKTHSEAWVVKESEDFHGNTLVNNGIWGIESCKDCHGVYYGGGYSDVSCSDCHEGGYSGHPETLAHLTPSSDQFHAFGFTQETFDNDVGHCIDCHTILEEGNEIISCYECHQHYPFFE